MPPEPYRIDVPQADLDDLRDRLLRTRWIDAPDDGWAHGASPVQVRLAWALSRGPHVLVIPGTGTPGHLEDNVAAGALRLTPD